MKSPFVLLSALCCMAGAALAADPAAAPEASPTPSPARHHHRVHHAAPPAAPTPSPSATPAKPRGLAALFARPEKKTVAVRRATPAATPKASPKLKAPLKNRAPVAAAATPAPSRPAHPWWSFGGLFSRHAKVAPAPAPSPTPVVKARRHRKPKPDATAPDETSATPAPSETEAPAPPPEQPRARHKGSGITSQVPFVPPEGATPENVGPPEPASKSPVADAAAETQRFHEVRDRALADKKVQDLQSKADNAAGDEERAALRAYYKALYAKMREIDPALHERIQRTEAASLRRADSAPSQ